MKFRIPAAIVLAVLFSASTNAQSLVPILSGGAGLLGSSRLRKRFSASRVRSGSCRSDWQSLAHRITGGSPRCRTSHKLRHSYRGAIFHQL